MTQDKFKTNYPDDASGQVRGDLMNKLGRALNAIKPEKEEAKRRRTDCDRIVNLSATALVRGQILQVGDTFNDRGCGADDITRTLGADGLRPIAYEPCLVGVAPLGRVHEIAVLQENAAIGEVAECQLDGVCTAWVNITSKAHRFAKAIAGSHNLQSAMCGHARIYWSPNETGLQLCRVRLGPPHAVHLLAYVPYNGIAGATVTGLSATAGSETCELWQREMPTANKASGIHSVPTDTGSAILTETIYNWFEDPIEGNHLVLVVSDDDFLFNVFCHDYPEASSGSSVSKLTESSLSSCSISSCSPSSVSSLSTVSSPSSVCSPSSVSTQSASSLSTLSTMSTMISSQSTDQLGYCCPDETYVCFGPVLRSVCETDPAHVWYLTLDECVANCAEPPGAMGRIEDPDDAAAKERRAAKARAKQEARLTAIRSGTGVGSQVWNLLAEFGVQHDPRCDCLTWAEMMNDWGPAGCRTARAEIIEHLKQEAKRLGWLKTIKTAIKAALSSETYRWIDLLDVYGSLVDEAIRRAESAQNATPG